MSKSVKVTLFIILLLTIDQITKILVKTNMNLYEDIQIFKWFHIHFIENPGMAFGITLGSKTVLTLFRPHLCRSHRQYYRLYVLRTDILRKYSLGSGYVDALGWRLRFVPVGQGSRYGILPDIHIPCVGAFSGR